ncbi:hypothetical protein BKA65DRAFT_483531 [Rhexocercosporidium sp. MPI-PUGE-AT-0058]|nr:hypothetical protein BKA65DRAFT_483531 [Rhexocercosporidium sp. MPI-PUGE-AT-0058]
MIYGKRNSTTLTREQPQSASLAKQSPAADISCFVYYGLLLWIMRVQICSAVLKLLSSLLEERGEITSRTKREGHSAKDTDAIDIKDNTNIRGTVGLPNTPPNQIRTNGSAPAEKPPRKDHQRLHLIEPPTFHRLKALDDLHSFLTWIEAFPDLSDIRPKADSRTLGEILGPFAILWVAFAEAWVTKTARPPTKYPDVAPHIISQLPNDSLSHRISKPNFSRVPPPRLCHYSN